MAAMPLQAAGRRTRAGGVAAESEGRAAAGDERRFAAAGAAGTALEIVGIAGGAVEQVVAFEGEEQVGQIGARDGDAAGMAQASDQGGVGGGGRRVAASDGARGARRTGDFDGVFDAEGDAVQGAGIGARGESAVGRAGGIEGLVVEDFDGGIDARIDFGDARQVGLHEFQGRDTASANQARLLRGGEGEKSIHEGARKPLVWHDFGDMLGLMDERRVSDVGGTPGGLGSFLLGFAMTCVGGYLISNQVIVGGGYWNFYGGNTFGITLIPMLIGIAILFFGGRETIGWLLTAAGALFILAGVIANMHIYFQPTSLANTLIMLVLLVGGLGLIARALRPHGGA